MATIEKRARTLRMEYLRTKRARYDLITYQRHQNCTITPQLTQLDLRIKAVRTAMNRLHRSRLLKIKRGQPSLIAILYEGLNNTSNPIEILCFGPPSYECTFCGAMMWFEERSPKTSSRQSPRFGLCCLGGKVVLPLLKQPPLLLQELFRHNVDNRSRNFHENIRSYNSMFAFTSMGGTILAGTDNGRGPYSFKINGQNHHLIGSLLPSVGVKPKFAQLYIYDTQNEVQNRANTMPHSNSASAIDLDIIRELIEVLDNNNVLVKNFRMARDRLEQVGAPEFRMKLISSRERDGRQFNTPSCSEVAGFIEMDYGPDAESRDLIVEHRATGLCRINEIHPSYMAMQYPLIFPYGEDGYRHDIPYRNSGRSSSSKVKHVSVREYYAYRLQQRKQESASILCSGKLFHQFIVDAYTCIEETRLRWIRHNQITLRAELYSGLVDAVAQGDNNASFVGQKIVLPATHTGSPRYMIQNYHDAMAICRSLGYPDFFLTFTCNSKWPEIAHMLQDYPGQTVYDRPDVVNRVFNIRLDALIDDIKKKKYFGDIVGVLYTIEFQKRGLPHAHILLFLHPNDKCLTPAQIDNIISAELPCPKSDSIGYAAVKEYMMHGPCGVDRSTSPCMVKQKCTKYYPRPFRSRTEINSDGFPLYRRRTDDRFVFKNKIKLDNRNVVPYNRDLLVRHQAHMNLEFCNHSRSVKYLFKYIHKGPDRARAIILGNSNNGTGNTENASTSSISGIDEIKAYLDCRYVSASEACWRIFMFPINHREPGVERLTFHLENEQSVVFNDSSNLPELLQREQVNRTMFTEWMVANTNFPEARTLTYSDFPSRWVWNRSLHCWTRRKRGQCVGRLLYAHPTCGERYYLRLLLNIVKGARSFEFIRTIDNVVHPTYRGACHALGLLGDDKEWDASIKEASIWATGKQLRHLFATILLYCEVVDAAVLWTNNFDILTEDIPNQLRRTLNLMNLQPDRCRVASYALLEIEEILRRSGRQLSNYPGLELPDINILQSLTNRFIHDETFYDKAALYVEHEDSIQHLTDIQIEIYNCVVNSSLYQEGKSFFVYGHGGTGKTFLWKTVINRLRSEGHIVLVVASSGIASLLLPGGRTAHSRFNIPIKIGPESVCAVKHGSQLADLLKRTSLIIWDEAPMTHKFCFEALDRTLRDIMRATDITKGDKAFGGITIALSGDFRQILPVISKGGRGEIVEACIKQSYLWKYFRVFKLTRNMRLESGSLVSIDEIQEFDKWLLGIGDGEHGSIDCDSWVKIPDSLLLRPMENNNITLFKSAYPDFDARFTDPSYLQERAILSTTNEIVECVNQFILDQINSNEVVFYSADEVCSLESAEKQDDLLYPQEFVNNLKFSGIPNHALKLKIGVPVMLLRNINPHEGLCNGTRMVITQLGKWCIEAQIITGSHIGNKVFIPRIIMSPSDSNWPFLLKRRQYPLSLCFAMTINKSQGQSLNCVVVYLKRHVFTHGQLYVAVSRVTNKKGLKILVADDELDDYSQAKNVVYPEIFINL